MESGNQSRRSLSPLAPGAGALAVVGALPFFLATTFTGDDHLFLAYARHVRNPLVAFTTDMHGGEFYRPLPMVLWWLLGRGAGSTTWPFAVFALLLHLAVTLETGALVAAIARDRRAAVIAAAFFFVAPFTREAAYWYSASTDLLAVALGLGALLASLGGRALVANLVLATAVWSKESAAVVPLLAVVVHRTRTPESGGAAALKAGVRLLPGVVVVLVCRTVVLHGIGGSGDVVASFGGKLVQLALGLAQAFPGTEVLDPPVAIGVGLVAWVALGIAIGRWAFRAGRAGVRAAVPAAALGWIAVAVLPLLAAPWIVGARYFYLAFVGIAWLWGVVLARAPLPATVLVLAGLGGISFAQAVTRRADVVSYEARVAVTRRAVAAGLAQGHQTFHVACGIKDIDLVVKEGRALSGPGQEELVVLGDVPASFVSLPANRPSRVDFLLARPPLPPAGAYRFGDRRIAALARRGEDPTLDEVLAHLPDLRFLRLRLGPGGRIIARDLTETLKSTEPLEAP